ncbi:PASTA domain-containing protein [Methanosarcina sp. KYL-1]|uniref:PASTA domain-containing protein n=1 Tax=Methanosarcina sp. KYL-1 TaxID=2602068 RepID=UPI0021016BF9|nr:PASTA domain-containing protein [Methanosarcina sp. KYL-1]MCQ1535681.1 PASTA domain-containing protein [Methanosarcina sp. KYL-1]
METQLEQRLKELRAEYESGQNILNDIENKLIELENRKTNLKETLLRISGAIDLLKEILGEGECVTDEPVGQAEEKAVSQASVEIVEVPNLIRKTLKEAEVLLGEAGLEVGNISEKTGIFPIGIRFGDILRQDPKPQARVAAGSPVDLVIAVKGESKLNPDEGSMCNRFFDRD